jgi:hypothetical protein
VISPHLQQRQPAQKPQRLRFVPNDLDIGVEARCKFSVPAS